MRNQYRIAKYTPALLFVTGPYILDRSIMHRSSESYTPYYRCILTKDYRQDFTSMYLLTIEHIAMFVVKSIHINRQVYGLPIEEILRYCFTRGGFFQPTDCEIYRICLRPYKKVCFRVIRPCHTGRLLSARVRVAFKVLSLK